jgi:lipopolysaccharide/colanic/teichoic acid biosynthesis glycosyltransferase
LDWRAGEFLVALILAALLAPVGLLLAFAIRMDSPGPVLFGQRRVGRGGRPFTIWKFRTMRTGAAGSGPGVTADGDRRITRTGRWLRRLKLDELPQLWNVLAGDMSLVGPRPELPEYVGLYPEAIRRKVLSVRPGLTDLATLTFIDESRELGQAADPERHYVESLLPRKLELAVRYVDHRSFSLDLRILLATLSSLLGWRWVPRVDGG